MGIGSSSGYLRICPDHSGVVPGGAGTYDNGTGEVLDQPKWFPDYRWTSQQLSRSSVILDCNPDRPETYPDSSGTSENSPERSWKYSKSACNVPKPSRKVPEWPRMVPEGPGRSRKVPEVSGQYHPLHPPPGLGGKPPGLAQVGQEVGAHQGGGSPTWTRTPRWEGFPLGVGVPKGPHTS